MPFFYRIALIGRTFLKVFWSDIQLIRGIWKITKVKGPIISIFGGSRLPIDDPYAKQAHKLAQKLVSSNINIMTGGGPGIMQAASCGAVHGKKSTSIGIGVSELGEAKNPCVKEYFEVNYFSTRKWLLTHYSIAFIVFPGGFGTLDELAEVIRYSNKKTSHGSHCLDRRRILGKLYELAHERSPWPRRSYRRTFKTIYHHR